MLPWVAASCDVFGDRFFWLSVTIAVSHVWRAGGAGGGPDRVPGGDVLRPHAAIPCRPRGELVRQEGPRRLRTRAGASASMGD